MGTVLYLVKIIDKKWQQASIKGESIRIGSINFYRNHENPIIRDETEGGGSISAKFKLIDSTTFNKLMVFDGLRMNDDWNIDANHCPIISQPNPFNTFVFSCAYVESLSEINKLKEIFGRESVYFITDPMHFIYSSAEILKSHLGNYLHSNLNMISPDSRLKLNRLHVYPVIGRVKYTDVSKDLIVNEKNVQDFNPRTFSVNTHFQKQTKFSDEKEVRVIWTATLGSIDDSDMELISIPDEYIDVKLSCPRFTASAKQVKSERLINKEGGRIILHKPFA